MPSIRSVFVCASLLSVVAFRAVDATFSSYISSGLENKEGQGFYDSNLRTAFFTGYDYHRVYAITPFGVSGQTPVVNIMAGDPGTESGPQISEGNGRSARFAKPKGLAGVRLDYNPTSRQENQLIGMIVGNTGNGEGGACGYSFIDIRSGLANPPVRTVAGSGTCKSSGYDAGSGLTVDVGPPVGITEFAKGKSFLATSLNCILLLKSDDLVQGFFSSTWLLSVNHFAGTCSSGTTAGGFYTSAVLQSPIGIVTFYNSGEPYVVYFFQDNGKLGKITSPDNTESRTVAFESETWSYGAHLFAAPWENALYVNDRTQVIRLSLTGSFDYDTTSTPITGLSVSDTVTQVSNAVFLLPTGRVYTTMNGQVYEHCCQSTFTVKPRRTRSITLGETTTTVTTATTTTVATTAATTTAAQTTTTSAAATPTTTSAPKRRRTRTRSATIAPIRATVQLVLDTGCALSSSTAPSAFEPATYGTCCSPHPWESVRKCRAALTECQSSTIGATSASVSSADNCVAFVKSCLTVYNDCLIAAAAAGGSASTTTTAANSTSAASRCIWADVLAEVAASNNATLYQWHCNASLSYHLAAVGCASSFESDQSFVCGAKQQAAFTSTATQLTTTSTGTTSTSTASVTASLETTWFSYFQSNGTKCLKKCTLPRPDASNNDNECNCGPQADETSTVFASSNKLLTATATGTESCNYKPYRIGICSPRAQNDKITSFVMSVVTKTATTPASRRALRNLAETPAASSIYGPGTCTASNSKTSQCACPTGQQAYWVLIPIPTEASSTQSSSDAPTMEVQNVTFCHGASAIVFVENLDTGACDRDRMITVAPNTTAPPSQCRCAADGSTTSVGVLFVNVSTGRITRGRLTTCSRSADTTIVPLSTTNAVATGATVGAAVAGGPSGSSIQGAAIIAGGSCEPHKSRRQASAAVPYFIGETEAGGIYFLISIGIPFIALHLVYVGLRAYLKRRQDVAASEQAATAPAPVPSSSSLTTSTMTVEDPAKGPGFVVAVLGAARFPNFSLRLGNVLFQGLLFEGIRIASDDDIGKVDATSVAFAWIAIVLSLTLLLSCIVVSFRAASRFDTVEQNDAIVAMQQQNGETAAANPTMTLSDVVHARSYSVKVLNHFTKPIALCLPRYFFVNTEHHNAFATCYESMRPQRVRLFGPFEVTKAAFICMAAAPRVIIRTTCQGLHYALAAGLFLSVIAVLAFRPYRRPTDNFFSALMTFMLALMSVAVGNPQAGLDQQAMFQVVMYLGIVSSVLSAFLWGFERFVLQRMQQRLDDEETAEYERRKNAYDEMAPPPKAAVDMNGSMGGTMNSTQAPDAGTECNANFGVVVEEDTI